MKTTRILLIVFYIISTWTYATASEMLSLQEQENVRQFSQEMNAQGIAEEQAQKMLSLMYQYRYRDQNIVRAKKTVMNAAQEGLPTGPLMNKAMEGMAKQVAQEQVVAAMETVRNRYSYAYRLTKSLSDDKKANEPIAEAIVDSLAAGIPDEEINAIMARIRTQTRQQTRSQADDLALQTMLTVRTMAWLGANPDDTSDTVSQALQHRYTARQMEQLRHRFTDEAQSTPAKQLAQQYTYSFGSGGNDSGGNGSGGNDSGGNDSGGNGSGGNGGGGRR